MNDLSKTRVCAVVVTFNRKKLLAECLRALQEQLRPVDVILVVDNASTDGTGEMLRAEFPGVEVLALKKNGGGAGGFYAGMKHAFEAGFDWIWLMDDDGKPAPDCLQLLLEAASESSEMPGVVLPVQQDNLGRFYGINIGKRGVAGEIVECGKVERGAYLFTFVGPLISRAVVERVGLPIKEFFIWLDDFEYALRIQKMGAPMLAVPQAHFFHDPGGIVKEVYFLGRRSVRAQQPAWKIYYGARNGLYIITRAHFTPREITPFFLNEFKLLLGDLIYESERWPRMRMRLRGIRDGLSGRLGKRH
ncbi:MAG: glycosyltransferase family 2 protein [Armatimonadetes bacterium]|nr:glycosyltransferase family 2 protein [Armatimonadota bacterium]